VTRTLVLGGIRSGKSRWAEAALAASSPGPAAIRYLATGPLPGDDPEWTARVAAHRARRRRSWITVESADVAAQLRAFPTSAALVDDVGGWLTAAMDRGRAWDGGSVQDAVSDLLSAVATFTSPLVLVSPEVGLTIVPATEAGRVFTDALGELNQQLAAACDRVVLVIAGVAVAVKPGQESH
jgi:adenosylcobinamide kinase / adenosylcobinamide-phosphate guanylyltransferase